MPAKRAQASKNLGGTGDPNSTAALLQQLQQHQLGGDPNGSLQQQTMTNIITHHNNTIDDLRGFVLTTDVTVAASQHPLAQTAMSQSLDFVHEQRAIAMQQLQEGALESNTKNENANHQHHQKGSGGGAGGRRSATPNTPRDEATTKALITQPLFIPDASSISVEFYVPTATAFEALSSSVATAAATAAHLGNNPNAVGNSATEAATTTPASKGQAAHHQQQLQQQQGSSCVSVLPASPNQLGNNTATDPSSSNFVPIAQAVNVNPKCLPPATTTSYANSSNISSYDPRKEWTCIGRTDLMTQFSYMNYEAQQETLANLQQQVQDSSTQKGGGGAKGGSGAAAKNKQAANQKGGGASGATDQQSEDKTYFPFVQPILPTTLNSPLPPSYQQHLQAAAAASTTTSSSPRIGFQNPQYQQGILFQQKKVLIPAPNFVKDFLCNEFVAVLVISSPTDKETAVQNAVLNCGQELPIVDQLKHHLAQLEKQSTSSSSGAGATATATGGKGNKNNSKTTVTSSKSNAAPSSSSLRASSTNKHPLIVEDSDNASSSKPPPYEIKTYSFVFNLGAGFSSRKCELLHVVNPHTTNTSADYQYQLSGSVSPSLNNNNTTNVPSINSNNKSLPYSPLAPKQFEIIPGIENFTIKFEADGNLLEGRNKRRFPVAFFDIHSINDIPPPALSLPKQHSASVVGGGSSNMNNNNNNSGSSPLTPGETALDLRLNTLSPAAVTTTSNNNRQQLQQLDSARIHQQLSSAQVAPPRIAFMWNNQVVFTPRARFSTDARNNSCRWLFQYSRPLYAPFGTSAAEGRSGAAFALLRQLWYSTMDFAVFDNEKNPVYSSSSVSSSSSGAGNKYQQQSSSSSPPQNVFLHNLVQPLPSIPPSAFAKLSLRDLVELGTTSVEETVPVLPERPEVSFSLSEVGSQKVRVPHYVAFGTTLKCRVRLSAPLPFPVYVPPVPRNLLSASSVRNNNTNNTNNDNNNNGIILSVDTLKPSDVKQIIAPFENPQEIKKDAKGKINIEDSNTSAAAFLTRIVLTLPYRSEMTKNVLRAVYSYLIQAAEKGNKTSDLFELPLLNEGGTDFAGDHFVDDVTVLNKLGKEAAAANAANQGGNKKGGGGGGNTGRGAASTMKNVTKSVNPDLLAAANDEQQKLQEASAKEKEAFKRAHALEDSELAFHPFGNAMRRRLFISVPDEVSGLELIDGDVRLVVIEAPCPIVAKVADLASEVAGPELHNMRMLFNYELPFMRRDYHVWPPLVRPLHITSQAALLKQQQAQLQQQQQQQLAAQNSARRPSSVDRQSTPSKSTSSNKRRPSPNAAGKLSSSTTSRPTNKKLTAKELAEQQERERQQQQQEALQKQQQEKEALANADSNGLVNPQMKLSSLFGGGLSSAAASSLAMEPLPDLDPGALGGRIRRVRLSCTLKSILQDPSQFLKRSLPSDAIDAAIKLSSLAGIQLTSNSSSSSPFLTTGATNTNTINFSNSNRTSNGVINPPETMLEALQRDMFPSQASIVSLERAVGDCLSTEDVCCDGENWAPYSKDFDVDAFADELAKMRIEKATQQLRDQHLLTEHTQKLSKGRLPRVGTVLSFIGIPATARDLGLTEFGGKTTTTNQQEQMMMRKFPPIARVAQQYPKSRKSYVKVLQASFLVGNKVRTDENGDPIETATTVSTAGGAGGDNAICWPCVFPHGVVLTNQPIRFEITGQVVPSRNDSLKKKSTTMNDGTYYDETMTDSILFVLDCKAYSAEGSDCHNPEFDKKKQQDKRIVPPKEYKKQMAKRTRQQHELDRIHKEKKELEGDASSKLPSASILNKSANSLNNNNVQDSSLVRSEALSLRASYEKSRQRKLARGGGGDLEEQQNDISSSDGEDDSPPQKATTTDSGRSKSYLPIPQKDWHSLALQDMRNKSSKNAQMKDQNTMEQAAKYQRAAELYQKQQDQQEARDAVIENLRANLANRPSFRSHQLRTSKDDNRHPKALETPLGSRDVTPNPFLMRSGEGNNNNNNVSSSSSSAPGKLLPPMKFLNASKAFNSDAVYAFNIETEEELERQKQERIEREKEEYQRKMLVSDPVFHVTTRKPRDHPLVPLDAVQSILAGEPKKKSIKQAYAPPPPISLREGHVEERKERVDPKVSKHPEVKQFVYTKKNLTEPLPKRVTVVSESEKTGAFWGK